ncbi:MAG: polysaccharide biosynthesis/export family protein [Opitutaceae bacterium]|jgi:polysaccharide export outer membrane protein
MSPKLSKFLLVCLFSPLAVVAEDKPAKPIAAGVSSDYVIQPSDLISVQIFQEEDLKREVRVSLEYSVTLPLIGKVYLKGKTVHQAEAMIRELYDKDYLVNPQVNVVVIDYAKRSVNILGAVGSPGVVLFPQEQGLTLVDAISRAGGFNRLADRKKVKLTRTNADGKAETYIIDADSLIQGKSSNAWLLLVNDVIYVPESIL